MISTMREYFRSLKVILLFVIVAFVATSVVYFGAASMSGSTAPSSGAVAVVNGEEITHERYRRAYANYVELYRQMYKDQLTPEMAERLGLGRQVIDALVQEVLIVQQADARGPARERRGAAGAHPGDPGVQRGRPVLARPVPRGAQAGQADDRRVRARPAARDPAAQARGGGARRREGHGGRGPPGLRRPPRARARGVGAAVAGSHRGADHGAGRGGRAVPEEARGAIHARGAAPGPVRGGRRPGRSRAR